MPINTNFDAHAPEKVYRKTIVQFLHEYYIADAIIPVTMEKEMRDQNEWSGALGFRLGDVPVVDFAQTPLSTAAFAALLKRISQLNLGKRFISQPVEPLFD